MASQRSQSGQKPSMQDSTTRSQCSSAKAQPAKSRLSQKPRLANEDHKDIPSYAKSTKSHDAKIISHWEAVIPGPAKNPQRSPILSIVAPATSKQSQKRGFTTSQLSTISSRRRAVNGSGPFRFLDLPADIRNLIYGLIECEKGMNPIKMVNHLDPFMPNRVKGPALVIDLHARNWRARMPSILRVLNKQLREEFASYYFTKRMLRIEVFDWMMSEQLTRFKNFIGPENCLLLDSNSEAEIAIRGSPGLFQIRRWNSPGMELYTATAVYWQNGSLIGFMAPR